MSDLIYTLEYLRLPHPLQRGKYIVRGNDYNFQRTLQQVYPLYNNPRNNLPRIQRKLFSPFSLDQERLKKEVNQYESNLVKRRRGEANLRLTKAWARLGVCFASSYLIWTILWSLPWLYSTIDAAFRAIGDFLSPYAVVIMILAPSIAALYFALTGKNSLWRICRGVKPLELCSQLGKDHTSRFIQDIKKLDRNIRKKIGRTHPVNQEIENLVKNLQNREWDKIKDNLQILLDRVAEDPYFPWGEKENIKAMVEDVLYHLKNRFRFAPLRILSPDEEELLPAEKLKLTELSQFFSSSQFIHLQEEIISRFDSLKRASSTEERIRLSGEISLLFQRTVFLSSRYHLGDSFLPYERGIILKDLYYHLFVTFGKMSYFLRRKKPGNLGSARLVKKTIRKIELFLNHEKKEDKFGLLKLLSNPAGGIVLSLGILIGVMLLTGFHLLNPEEFSIIHWHRFAYQGFLGEEVVVRDFSHPAIFTWKGGKLFWYPPKPFAFVHNVNLNKTYHVDVFMILKEIEPSGIVDRFFHLFREEWGRGYSGINLRFVYRIVKPELWARYDYDGRGGERLSRDLESYILQYTEKTREEYRRKLYTEEPEKLESHFKRCLAQGKISEWIRRFLYPSIFDTYRTGSIYERYLTGLRWLQEHPRMRDKPEWREFVEHEIKNIEKLVRQENKTLISRPLEVKKIIKSPTLSGLHRYENLYRTLTYLVVEDLINERILQEVKTSAITDPPDPVTGGIVEWLQQNCELQKLIGIKITGIERSVREVSALGWQNELRKRENLI